ncbi:unnamed protein product [Eretmochelys imbricata]
MSACCLFANLWEFGYLSHIIEVRDGKDLPSFPNPIARAGLPPTVQSLGLCSSTHFKWSWRWGLLSLFAPFQMVLIPSVSHLYPSYYIHLFLSSKLTPYCCQLLLSDIPSLMDCVWDNRQNGHEETYPTLSAWYPGQSTVVCLHSVMKGYRNHLPSAMGIRQPQGSYQLGEEVIGFFRSLIPRSHLPKTVSLVPSPKYTALPEHSVGRPGEINHSFP